MSASLSESNRRFLRFQQVKSLFHPPRSDSVKLIAFRLWSQIHSTADLRARAITITKIGGGLMRWLPTEGLTLVEAT